MEIEKGKSTVYSEYVDMCERVDCNQRRVSDLQNRHGLRTVAGNYFTY